MWLNELSKGRLARWVAGAESSKPRRQTSRPRGLRLRLEQLEDRTLLSNYTAATVSDLIADINAANLAGGSNTIALVAGKTFTLSAVNNNTDGPTGLPVIAVNDNLSIAGNGDTIERSTATGTPDFRLFDVAVGAALTLANLTLQGGFAYGNGEILANREIRTAGGAILNQGSLSLSGVTVQNNIAQGVGAGIGAGGGIYSNGSLTLQNCTLQNNQALGGNGAYIGYPGYPGFGGGLDVSGGTASLTNVTLYSNTARGGDGAQGGTVEVCSRWGGCYKEHVPGGNGGDGVGGGMFVEFGTVMLHNSTVDYNSAVGGKGASGSPNGLGEGGGLYMYMGTVVHLDAFTLTNTINNTASTSNNNIFGSYTTSAFFWLAGFPSPTTAGVAGIFTVTAIDSSGNQMTGYTGTVHISSTDPQAVLPADYTFTAADAGVHMFAATLKTASTNNIFTAITTTDTTLSWLTGSVTGITVNPAAVRTFTVVTGPANGWPKAMIISGQAFPVSVFAYDPYGNLVPSYTGTVHLTSSDPQAVLPGDYSFTAADQGEHDFTVTLVAVGTPAITVADTANSTVTGTGSFNVAPWAMIAGPSVVQPNQSGTYTLTAGGGGLPPGTIFTWAISWDGNGTSWNSGPYGNGIVEQTVSGPSGTTVTHTFTTINNYNIQLAATVGSTGVSSLFAYPTVLKVGVFPWTIEPDPANPNQYALVFHLTSPGYISAAPGFLDGNAVSVAFGSATGTISAPGGVAFAHLIIYGGAGSNSIVVSSGNGFFWTVPVLIFGGDANDGINLQSTFGNNVLVGGAGNDTLNAGSGRDILIGGSGANTLVAGSGDDIMIAGSTSYDNNITALLALSAEWGRTDANYATRVAHLQGTLSGGLNGSYFLNTSTVFDDPAGVVDWLIGGSGMDWFFADTKGTSQDIIRFLTTGEVVTSIS